MSAAAMSGLIDSARNTQGRHRCSEKRTSVSAPVSLSAGRDGHPADDTPLESDHEFRDGLSPHTRVLDVDETDTPEPSIDATGVRRNKPSP